MIQRIAKVGRLGVVTDQAEKTGHVEDKDVVNVFVTRYERDDGVVREMVKLVRRLASEQGYQVDEQKIGGARTLTINGHGESWVIWPAPKHVVKVGGRGRDNVPGDVVASYADRYPSKLPGGALEGPLPGGPEPAAKPKDDGSKDFENYDPKKVKLPSQNKSKDQ